MSPVSTKHLVATIAMLFAIHISYGQMAIPQSFPNDHGSNNGKIGLMQLSPNSKYMLSYVVKGLSTSGSVQITTDNNGVAIVDNLYEGVYAGFSLTPMNGTGIPVIKIADTVKLLVLPQITYQPTDVEASIGTDATFFCNAIPPQGAAGNSGLTVMYQWQLNAMEDSNFMHFVDLPGQTSAAMVVKTVKCIDGGNQFRCKISLVNGTTVIGTVYSKLATLTVTGCIAQKSSVEFIAAVYTGAAVKNDDASSLTQTYLRLVIPGFNSGGIESNAPLSRRFLFSRNVMFQLTYSTNINNLSYLDANGLPATNVQDLRSRYVNKLDLYENANFNFNLTWPALTFVVPSKVDRNNDCIGDLAHIYFDPICSVLGTTINDSTSYVVTSLLYGLNITYRTENISPFWMEISAQAFYISTWDSRLNPNLQYQERVATQSALPAARSVGNGFPYYHLDVVLMYNLIKNDNSTNVFLHGAHFDNYLPGLRNNSYYQIQVGAAVNMAKLFQTWAKP